LHAGAVLVQRGVVLADYLVFIMLIMYHAVYAFVLFRGGFTVFELVCPRAQRAGLLSPAFLMPVVEPAASEASFRD
jgi:hypothetical protein